MIQAIDYLVIVIQDLHQAARDYTRLGFTVVPGGRHPVGSHNALISFHDGSYLELIAFYREAFDHRWWEPLSKGERLVDFCFQTDDLRGDTKKLSDAGAAISDPVPWSRKRPDGYELKWLLSLATGSHRGVAPFLIEDITPREERIPREMNHANEVTGIAKVTVAAGELGQIEQWYSALLNARGQSISDNDLDGEGLRFNIGEHVLEFLAPRSSNSPLVNWLRQYGPSPYRAVFKSAQPTARHFDAALTHGAKLFIE